MRTFKFYIRHYGSYVTPRAVDTAQNNGQSDRGPIINTCATCRLDVGQMRVFVGLRRATRLLRPQEYREHTEGDAALMDVAT